RLVPVAGLEDYIVLQLQDLPDQIAHLALALDYEPRLAAGRRRNGGGDRGRERFGRCLRLRNARQVDLERRAGPRVAHHADLAAELGDDIVDRREADPGATPGLLGREVRLEQPRAGLVVHTAAGIAHRQHDHLPDVRGLDGETPALRHRVTRIDHEIHDDLTDLMRVGADAAQLPVEPRHQLDILAEQGLEDARHVPDELVQIDRRGIRRGP